MGEELQGKYQKDVFFLTHLAPGKKPGDPVVFELGINVRGEPQALKLHCGAALAQGSTKEEIMATPPLREYGPKTDDHREDALNVGDLMHLAMEDNGDAPVESAAKRQRPNEIDDAENSDDPFAAFQALSAELA